MKNNDELVNKILQHKITYKPVDFRQFDFIHKNMKKIEILMFEELGILDYGINMNFILFKLFDPIGVDRYYIICTKSFFGETVNENDYLSIFEINYADIKILEHIVSTKCMVQDNFHEGNTNAYIYSFLLRNYMKNVNNIRNINFVNFSYEEQVNKSILIKTIFIEYKNTSFTIFTEPDEDWTSWIFCKSKDLHGGIRIRFSVINHDIKKVFSSRDEFLKWQKEMDETFGFGGWDYYSI